MAIEQTFRTTVSSKGAVNVLQRRSLLMMVVRLRANESTLELGLANLNEQREVASKWLDKLGALRIEFSEPFFVRHIETDPRKQLMAAVIGKHPKVKENVCEVQIVVSALWDISALSAEQTLIFFHRLLFETSPDTADPKVPKTNPRWATKAEPLGTFLSELQQAEPDDESPEFLFISRLNEEQMQNATTEAFTLARQNAEMLARSSGMSLGKIWMVSRTTCSQRQEGHARMMAQQRYMSILADTSYKLEENEMVSDDPRSVTFTVSVSTTYYLE